MTNENGEYKHSENDKGRFVAGELTLGKLLFFLVLTLAFSGFGPLSLFAPVPMAFAYILYGALKTSVVGIVVVGALMALATFFPAAAFLGSQAGVFFVAMVFGFFASHVIAKGQRPVQGLLRSGFIILSAVLLLVGGVAMVSEVPVTEQLNSVVTKTFETALESENVKSMLAAGGPEARVLEMTLKKPADAVKLILDWSFTAVFVGIFFTLWLTLFLVFRNTFIWKDRHNYPYKLKDFVNFRTPDYLIYPLLAGMGLILGTEYIGPWAEVVGYNVIYSLGVFYFFQGFGCYLAFLDFLSIKGFLRTFLTMFTIFMGFKVVALTGVLDLFFDFKNKLKKKSRNEGDII